MMLRNNSSVRLACVLLSLAGAACSTAAADQSGAAANTGDRNGNNGSNGNNGNNGQAQSFCSDLCFGACSEAQLVSIMTAFNQGEITLSQTVLSRTQNPAVRDLAQRMIDDHGRMNQALGELGVSAETQNGLVTVLATTAQLKVQLFQSMDVSQIDQMYVNEMLLAHVQVLGMLEHVAIPSAQRNAFQTAFGDARTAVGGHIGMILSLQGTLAIKCGSGNGCAMQQDGGTSSEGGSSSDGGASASEASVE